MRRLIWSAGVGAIAIAMQWTRAEHPVEHLERGAMHEGPRLLCFLKSDRDVEPTDRLEHGTSVMRGDIVQLAYAATGNQYGVVVSFDGAGAVTLHMPVTSEGSTRVHPRGVHMLDHAFELDAAPRFERFVFVTSAVEPIDVDEVLRAASMIANGPNPRARPLHLPDHLLQRTLVLRKAQ